MRPFSKKCECISREAKRMGTYSCWKGTTYELTSPQNYKYSIKDKNSIRYVEGNMIEFACEDFCDKINMVSPRIAYCIRELNSVT